MSLYDDLTIYIPSLNRAGKVVTTRSLDAAAKQHTYLVVRKDQVPLYTKTVVNGENWSDCGVRVIAEPDWCKHIGHCRQWLIQSCPTRYMIMLDDDLSFSIRPTHGDWHLLNLPVEGWSDMLEIVMNKVKAENLAHASLSFREFANTCLADWAYNQRYTRFFLYDLSQFYDIELGRMTVLEDFDVSLQLLRKGRPSAICYAFAQGQSMSGAEGGCSTYRDMSVQEEGARKLQQFHPEYVRLVKKKTKWAWNGAERTDVNVRWKKAYMDAYNANPDKVVNVYARDKACQDQEDT